MIANDLRNEAIVEFLLESKTIFWMLRESEMFWCKKYNLGSGYLIYCVVVCLWVMWVCVGVSIFWKRNSVLEIRYNERNQNAKFQRINYS